jgi:hypothetical protein
MGREISGRLSSALGGLTRGLCAGLALLRNLLFSHSYRRGFAILTIVTLASLL